MIEWAFVTVLIYKNAPQKVDIVPMERVHCERMLNDSIDPKIHKWITDPNVASWVAGCVSTNNLMGLMTLQSTKPLPKK